MLYVARDGAGGITAICDKPVTDESLRALIDVDIVTRPTAEDSIGDYVTTRQNQRRMSL